MITYIIDNRVQFVAVLCSILFLLFIIELIRKEYIKEAYALLWLFMGGIFLILSVWRDGLEVLSRFIGVAYPPAALFLVLILFITLILIQFSIVISMQNERIKKLTQEIGILKTQIKTNQKIDSI